MKKIFFIPIITLLYLTSCSNNIVAPHRNEKYYFLGNSYAEFYSSSLYINDNKYLMFENNMLTYHPFNNLKHECLYKTGKSMIYVSNVSNTYYGDGFNAKYNLDNAIANNEEIKYSLFGEVQENGGMCIVFAFNTQGGIEGESLFVTESYARSVGIQVINK